MSGEIVVTLPPLRDRGDDVILLFKHFLGKMGRESGRKFVVEPAVLACLKNYSWPGNVRELHNVAERVASLAEGETISPVHLPPEIYNPYGQAEGLSFSQGVRLGFYKEQRRRQKERAEREELAALLGECGGNVSQVARRMEVARSTVYRKLRAYAIPCREEDK